MQLVSWKTFSTTRGEKRRNMKKDKGEAEKGSRELVWRDLERIHINK